MNSRADSLHHSDSKPTQLDLTVNPSRISLIVLLMLCLILAVNITYRLLAQNGVGIVCHIINDGDLCLDESDQIKLRRDLNARLADLDVDLEQSMQLWEENALAEIQANFQNAGENYLDWYFSLTGSYARLGVTAMGDLEPWMESQLEERLVRESGIETLFIELREEYGEKLVDAQRAWLDEMLAILHQQYTPVSISESEVDISSINTVNLDQIVESAWQDKLAVPRWSVSQVAMGGGSFGVMAGPAIAKRIAALPAMQAGRTIVRQFITRVGIQVGRSAAMGGTVAAIASPTGPGAAVAGTVVLGTSLALAAGSEFVILKAQEALQRPDMEAELNRAWDELELEAKRILQAERQVRAEIMLEHLERRAEQEVQSSELPRSYRILR